jgi:hypothetical protein
VVVVEPEDDSSEDWDTGDPTSYASRTEPASIMV